VEFQRFLKGATPGETVYLICTSAGEVGIDISADHMVCDLSPFDSMAQRFGRVNRYGLRSDSEITVVHSNKFDEKASGPARKLTLEILTQLNGDASPRALSDLRGLPNIAGKIEHAFTPQPEIPRVSDILFDAWSLTSITKPLPGRPPVAPYLHGIAEWQPPETHVAWREEIDNVTGDLLSRHPAKDLLDDFPLLPHELLRDRSDRVLKQLQILAKRIPQVKAWLLSGDGGVEQVVLAELVSAKNAKDEIADKTVVLPPSAGGLDEQGMLDGDAELASDAAENQNRQRIWDGEVPVGMVIVREIDTRPDADSTTDEARGRRFWLWCERPQEGGRSGPRSVHWDAHVGNVVERAKQIVASLALPPPLDRAVIVAAQLHDHGKRREQFQRTLGNRDYPNVLLAKSNCRGTARLPEPFRHEFASVFDAENDSEFLALNEEMRDLALHMIAAHHGRARPHFDPGEGFDPDRTTAEAEGLRSEVPRRFARLQRRYGRWGLAYLESLLRAADWAASAEEAQHL
jgi:CRISPR-associated endonuclease/helicase Cas3